MLRVIDLHELMATDQNGKFLITTSSGAKYLMVVCELCGYAILVATLKNKRRQDDQSKPLFVGMVAESWNQTKTSNNEQCGVRRI